jgi:hypothetical protein
MQVTSGCRGGVELDRVMAGHEASRRWTTRREPDGLPIPEVIEETPHGERSYDLFSRLLTERIIMVGKPIDDELANVVAAQLIFLESEDPERDIWLYINSPGGAITSCSRSTTACSSSSPTWPRS